MLSPEQIIGAFNTILLRDPDGPEQIRWWQEHGINLRHLRDGLLESEEYRIMRDRERMAKTAASQSFETAHRLIEKHFGVVPEKASGSAPASRDIARALRGLVERSVPSLVLALGGETAEQYACFLASCAQSPTIVVSNATTGESPSGVVRVPVPDRMLLHILAGAEITPGLAVLGAVKPEEARTAYLSLPEVGAMICLPPFDAALRDALDGARALVWGDALHIEGHLLITKAVWPFCVDYPSAPEPATETFGGPTIALAAIVKNEERRIAKMLRSCAGLVSHVTLVDTGSTDGTLDQARAALGDMKVPYNIEHITFIDFAQARNAAIAAVPSSCAWILMLDADEFITPTDARRLAELTTSGDADAYALPRYNLCDELGTLGRYPDRQARFFRNAPDRLHFRNPVHEALITAGRLGFPQANMVAIGGSMGGPHIHHDAKMSVDVFAEKSAFYKRLSSQ
ncbi:glycosyltransferase [Methylobacterium organophilum]|uniref:glycosyltransferase n=1 Tax=Methylobacterium organophilum TaxID=410 RepID=UPI001F1394F5|nr:glycosyltransferase [Methylobacterium organophilum]UMY15560.1 glycosyltransferase [Methylobacterium organophilum]